MENAKFYKAYEKDGYYHIEVDTNKDGEPFVAIKISAKEGLDEAGDAVSKLVGGFIGKLFAKKDEKEGDVKVAEAKEENSEEKES